MSAEFDNCGICNLDQVLQDEIARVIAVGHTILRDDEMPLINRRECLTLIDLALNYAIAAKHNGNNLARKRALEILRGYD